MMHPRKRRWLCRAGFHNYDIRQIEFHSDPSVAAGAKADVLECCCRCGAKRVRGRTMPTFLVVYEYNPRVAGTKLKLVKK